MVKPPSKVEIMVELAKIPVNEHYLLFLSKLPEHEAQEEYRKFKEGIV